MYSEVCRDVAKANILLGYNVGLFQGERHVIDQIESTLAKSCLNNNHLYVFLVGMTNSTIGCMVSSVLSIALVLLGKLNKFYS